MSPTSLYETDSHCMRSVYDDPAVTWCRCRVRVYLDDAVLKISPGDKDAIHLKVIALIELSRFEEAVDVVDSNNFAADLAFEKVSKQSGLLAMTHLSCARDLISSVFPGVFVISAWELQ